MAAAAQQLELVDLPVGVQREAMDNAKEELKQGLEVIAARIKVADRSEYGWATVDEYKQDQLAADKEDAKRFEKLAGSEVAKWKKVSNTSRSENWKRQQGQPMEPARRFPKLGSASGSSQPALQAQTYKLRQPRLCFYCMEMGYLKATCPRLTRPYPLNIEPVNKCKTRGMVEESVIDKHVLDACPPSKVGTSDIDIDTLETHSGEMGNDSGLQREERSCVKDSELDIELGRYWELEQEGPQVSDVQGHLLANINFWEQVIEPSPQISAGQYTGILSSVRY